MANHFEGHSEISKNHKLFKNMKMLLDENGQNVYKVIPLTFSLKINGEETVLKQQLMPFKKVFKLLEEFKPIFSKKKVSGMPHSTPANASYISQNKDTSDASLYDDPRRSSEYIMPLSHFKGKNVWILKVTS
mmetsp:Transcript_30088/g.29337  ORF Transcript_30088/g.29337 Transcript_30088/m.29337 type:complete len:132 (+) Transcript_30088:886-1281(+)